MTEPPRELAAAVSAAMFGAFRHRVAQIAAEHGDGMTGPDARRLAKMLDDIDEMERQFGDGQR